MHYNGTVITEFNAQDGMEQPVVHWTPSIAPIGSTSAPANYFPAGRITSSSRRSRPRSFFLLCQVDHLHRIAAIVTRSP